MQPSPGSSVVPIERPVFVTENVTCNPVEVEFITIGELGLKEPTSLETDPEDVAALRELSVNNALIVPVPTFSEYVALKDDCPKSFNASLKFCAGAVVFALPLLSE